MVVDARTLVVNLYGGPGTGKSTTAAELFAKLKHAGVNAELVTEFAKEVTWDEHWNMFEDQIWLFANQLRRMKRLLGKVDVIVTDSPLLLNVYYDQNRQNGSTQGLGTVILFQHRQMKTLDIMLERVKKYNPKGRYQSETEAKKIDNDLKLMLYQLGEEVDSVVADEAAADKLFKLVMEKLK